MFGPTLYHACGSHPGCFTW